MKYLILILILGLILLSGCKEYQEDEIEVFFDMYGDIEPSQDYCLKGVKDYCRNLYKEDNEYGVDTEKYNKCKMEKFYSDCSKEDCIRYFAYNIKGDLGSMTQEEAQYFVDEHIVEPDIINCFNSSLT